jgi:hypothetical protein
VLQHENPKCLHMLPVNQIIVVENHSLKSLFRKLNVIMKMFNNDLVLNKQ